MKVIKYHEYRRVQEIPYLPDAPMANLPETLGYPKGWHSIVHELIGACFDAGWSGDLLQVKEKFGGLRFYITGGQPDAVNKLVSDAEDASYRTCQDCGNPGKTHGGSWIRTVCDKCCETYERQDCEEELKWLSH